jgi:hypothetical protein
MSSVRVLLAILVCTGSSAAADVHTLAGKTVSGELTALSDKEVVLQTGGGGLVATPVGQILTIDLRAAGAPPAGLKYSDIELTDGSLLHCSRCTFKGKEVEIAVVGSGSGVRIPLTAVASLLNEAHDAAVRQEWQEKVLAKKGNQDVLAVKLNGIINPLDGTLGEVNDKGEILFEYEVGGSRRKKDVDPGRVQGLVFTRSLGAGAPAPFCKAQDLNQSVLVAAKVALEGDKFVIATVAGAKVEYPRASLVRLDFTNDKVVYLSDLKPAELIEKSKQGRKDNVRLDKNLENATIQLEGQPYGKGLAVHAHTELLYKLDGKYKKFEAVVGMDDTVGGDGHPLVKIEADGKELFAGTITRKDKCAKLDKDVTGVKQLRILVTSNGLFDFGDHVDIANAKLSK